MIKWGIDYFIKVYLELNVLWGEVGDGDSDYDCWMWLEDMIILCKVYKIDLNNLGFDFVGEIFVVMVVVFIVFK